MLRCSPAPARIAPAMTRPKQLEARAGGARLPPPKLRKLRLRYYPPGLILEVEHSGECWWRTIDLPEVAKEGVVEPLVDLVMAREPLLEEVRGRQSAGRLDPARNFWWRWWW